MLLDVIVVVALILCNGLLAMAELAVVSAPKARLMKMAEKHAGAKVAMELAQNPTRFLSTIQIGITSVGVLAGAFGGATIAEAIAGNLQGTAAGPYGEAIGVAIVVSGITFVSLILGELVPKRLALANPEAIAAALAPTLKALAWLSTPAVWLLSVTGDALLRISGLHRVERAAVTEEEVRLLVEEGVKGGTIDAAEQDIVERVFQLGDRKADDIMTPRIRITWLNTDLSLAENLKVIETEPHSRYPVTQGDAFEVTGVIQIKDMVRQQCAGKPADPFQHLQPPLFVPESTRALKLLEIFKSTSMHMALVVDEYGSVAGLVTLNDILEGMVGEVQPADGRGDPRVVRREDGSYLVDGMLPADDLRHLLELDQLVRDEAGHDFNTLAGMVIAHLGRIPATGDRFEWSGWRFEVVDMDGPRVDKVLVSRHPAPP